MSGSLHNRKDVFLSGRAELLPFRKGNVSDFTRQRAVGETTVEQSSVRNVLRMRRDIAGRHRRR